MVLNMLSLRLSQNEQRSDSDLYDFLKALQHASSWIIKHLT